MKNKSIPFGSGFTISEGDLDITSRKDVREKTLPLILHVECMHKTHFPKMKIY